MLHRRCRRSGPQAASRTAKKWVNKAAVDSQGPRRRERVKNARLHFIPASEDTRGHGTTGMARF
jgi:hypothetical protein